MSFEDLFPGLSAPGRRVEIVHRPLEGMVGTTLGLGAIFGTTVKPYHWAIRVSVEEMTGTFGRRFPVRTDDLPESEWVYFGLNTRDIPNFTRVEECYVDNERFVPLPVSRVFNKARRPSGETSLDPSRIGEIAEAIMRDFNRFDSSRNQNVSSYNLFANNCQHFAVLLFAAIVDRWIDQGSLATLEENWHRNWLGAAAFATWGLTPHLCQPAGTSGRCSHAATTLSPLMNDFELRFEGVAYELARLSEPIVNKSHF